MKKKKIYLVAALVLVQVLLLACMPAVWSRAVGGGRDRLISWSARHERIAHQGTLVIDDNGNLYGVGDNQFLRISPTGSPYGTFFTRRRHILSNVLSVASGATENIALTADGTLYSWPGYPQGWGTDVPPSEQPWLVALMDGVSSIAAGTNHQAAVTDTGTLLIWGRDARDLGIGRTEADLSRSNGPYQVMEGMATVYIYDYTTFAISETGDLYLWGRVNRLEKTANGQMLTELGAIIDSPVFIASGVRDLACADREGTTFQLLAPDGTLSILELAPSEGGQPSAILSPAVGEDVRCVCEGGYIGSDGTWWRWERSADGLVAKSISERIVYARESMVISEESKLLSLSDGGAALKEVGSTSFPFYIKK